LVPWVARPRRGRTRAIRPIHRPGAAGALQRLWMKSRVTGEGERDPLRFRAEVVYILELPAFDSDRVGRCRVSLPRHPLAIPLRLDGLLGLIAI
ncbi:MAG: hypothetical protein ACE5MG_12280, partial [Candidatus Methylomirabilales bacterium]